MSKHLPSLLCKIWKKKYKKEIANFQTNFANQKQVDEKESFKICSTNRKIKFFY